MKFFPLFLLLAIFAGSGNCGALPQPEGKIDREAVNRVLRSHGKEYLSCYRTARMMGNPGLEGRVVYRVKIFKNRSAPEISLYSSTLNDPPVEQCVAKAIQGISTWPAPDTASAEVFFPIRFRPKNRPTPRRLPPAGPPIT